MVDRARVLRGSALFASADERTVATMVEASVERSFTEDEVVWRVGAPSDAAVLIVHGIAHVRRLAATGEEVTLALFGPREVVGLVASLEGVAYPAELAAASQRLDVLMLPTPLIRECVERDPAFARAVQAAIIAHTRALLSKIDILVAGSVEARLGALFAHLAERFGDDDGDGATILPVPLSRTGLSRLVGARVETVIRHMSQWQKEGRLETRADGFVLRDGPWRSSREA